MIGSSARNSTGPSSMNDRAYHTMHGNNANPKNVQNVFVDLSGLTGTFDFGRRNKNGNNIYLVLFLGAASALTTEIGCGVVSETLSNR